MASQMTASIWILQTRRIRLYGLPAWLMRGRALQLVKAVADSNGFDASWFEQGFATCFKSQRISAFWGQPLHGQRFL